MSKRQQVYMDAATLAAVERLKPLHGNNLSQVVRVAVAELADRTFEDYDLEGAIVGWSEVQPARQVAECALCGERIEKGQPFRAAYTVGRVGGVYAHDRCTND